ncbi:MAG: metallo-beta-lactamase [Flavobacteriales bacterium BRH_c54]|nr:MAG: metallo-beta-lactamase [Flavobacteriales bacterium BRH_c54]
MNNDNITIHFLGAAGTVTGSKYLIDTGDRKIMIDCGLFQGLKELRLKNWDYLPVNVAEIDTVLLTHGHMDHTGYLPRLVKMGFKGSILATQPTLAIAKIILLDSAKIQEEYAEQANKEGFTKHNPAEPLYTIQDAERAINHFKYLPEGEWITLYPEIKVCFQYNGHIIGATFIELDVHGKRFVFSGDVGRKEDLLMRSPKKPKRADVLFIESTYGDKVHPIDNLEEKLKAIVNDTVEKGGTLIIPSFAVERTQTLMYLLWQLHDKKAIPDIPMIMDSPMGANVLEVFHNYRDWHKLPIDDCTKMCNTFRVVQEYKETWEIIDNKTPKIIIAGSGMMSGGRVLTYLQQYIGRPETTVLLAGFQAEGTRGRKLLEGVREVKIYGKYYPVKAKIENLQVLSAHADQTELLDWMSEIKNTPEEVFIVHGETTSAKVFSDKVTETYGWNCEIPELYSIEDVLLKKND